jgi:hypothetical protein
LGPKSLGDKELRQKEFSRFLAISAQRKRAKFRTPKPLFWRDADLPRLFGGLKGELHLTLCS